MRISHADTDTDVENSPTLAIFNPGFNDIDDVYDIYKVNEFFKI